MMSRMRDSFKYRRQEVRPFALLGILLVFFLMLPLVRSGASVDAVNFKNILETLAALGLVSLALGLTMVAGEFDLSVSSTFLLGGMLAVTTGTDSWLVGVIVAASAGLAFGAFQGLVIAKLNINSMAVTLGGFIALLGLVFVISNSDSISYPNLDIGARLDQPILGIFSIRIFVAIAIFSAVAFWFSRTSFGRDLRAIGSDRRASRVAGVRISRLLIIVFALSGLLAAFAGALQGYSLGYATPDRTVSPLIFATTAALLGGVPLAGGRGNPLGIAAGVLSLGLIVEAVPILRSAEFVNVLVPAVLLLIVTVVDAPGLKDWWQETKARLDRGHRRTTAPAKDGGGKR